MAGRSINNRLHKLETFAPKILNGEPTNALAKIEEFVENNGGRLENESWADAAARLVDMPTSQLVEWLKSKVYVEDFHL